MTVMHWVVWYHPHSYSDSPATSVTSVEAAHDIVCTMMMFGCVAFNCRRFRQDIPFTKEVGELKEITTQMDLNRGGMGRVRQVGMLQ